MKQTYVLKKGYTGDLVRALQELLGVPVTGTFEQNTENVVKAFQKRVFLSYNLYSL